MCRNIILPVSGYAYVHQESQWKQMIVGSIYNHLYSWIIEDKIEIEEWNSMWRHDCWNFEIVCVFLNTCASSQGVKYHNVIGVIFKVHCNVHTSNISIVLWTWCIIYHMTVLLEYMSIIFEYYSKYNVLWGSLS